MSHSISGILRTSAVTGALLLSSSAFGQALTTTVGVNSSEAGVFNNTQFSQPNQFLLGGTTPSQIWGPNNKLADALTAIVKVPSPASLFQSNAVDGFADNYSTATAAVAGYFTARCNESSTLCWGINPQVTDRNDQGALTGIVMYGQETDVDVENPDTQVNGLAILGHFDAQPKSAWGARIVAAPGGGRWKAGYTTDDGAIIANGSGISLGAVNATPNSYSQELGLVGIDTNGVHQVAYLQATPSGGLNLSTTTGTFFGFYNGPVALNTLAASTSNTACLNGSTWNGLYLISACTSLRKYKGNISHLRPSLTEVMKLNPVSYVSKTSGNAEIGFVAEDVEKVDKRLSTYASGELTGVQYDHMVALLTKAMQEQQAQIKDLQEQVRALKGNQ